MNNIWQVRIGIRFVNETVEPFQRFHDRRGKAIEFAPFVQLQKEIIVKLILVFIISSYLYFALGEFHRLMSMHQFVGAKHPFVNTVIAFVLAEGLDGFIGENGLGSDYP